MGSGDLVEVNSGGQVLFCFFAPAGPSVGHAQRAAHSVDLGNLHRSSIPSPPPHRELSPPLHGIDLLSAALRHRRCNFHQLMREYVSVPSVVLACLTQAQRCDYSRE